jgi:hypothetical protein
MTRVYRMLLGKLQAGSLIIAPNGEEYVVYAHPDGAGMEARPLTEGDWHQTPEAAIAAEKAEEKSPAMWMSKPG